MKKHEFILIAFLSLLFFSGCAGKTTVPEVSGNYQVKAEYLVSPEKNIGFVKECADFWIPSFDEENGGFFTLVERDGSVKARNGLKTVLTQSRNAYGFARAYQMTGDSKYLDYAKSALDYQNEFLWDKENGGWFVESDADGTVSPDNRYNKEKWSFFQHYALLGLAAYCDAVHESEYLERLRKGIEVLDSKMWDSRPEYKGFYERTGVDWQYPWAKSFTATMDCMTTNGLSSALIFNEEKYIDRFKNVADCVPDYFIPGMEECNFGFAEFYTNEWEMNKKEEKTSVGHVLKASWCMGRAYLLTGDTRYRDAGKILIDEIWNKGYDHKSGGPFSNYNAFSGKQSTTNKEWWQMEQAVTAGLIQHYITGDNKYLKMADETVDFFMNHFIDTEYGEVFYYTTEEGRKTGESMKGARYKAAYHSIEQGFYTYMYGNLYLHHKPAVLHHYLGAGEEPRTVVLNPVPAPDGKLQIASVKLDGESYAGFNGETRSLTIEAGVEGDFEVTYILLP